MTHIFCWQDECIWSENGFCRKESVTIDADRECEDFEAYYDSYNDSYWIACQKDGKKFRRFVKNGKKIEYNGYVFYTNDRITEDEDFKLTESRTGYLIRSFKVVKEHWDKFIERAASYPDVESYPIEKKEVK